jgi:hypothetical protein
MMDTTVWNIRVVVVKVEVAVVAEAVVVAVRARGLTAVMARTGIWVWKYLLVRLDKDKAWRKLDPITNSNLTAQERDRFLANRHHPSLPPVLLHGSSLQCLTWHSLLTAQHPAHSWSALIVTAREVPPPIAMAMEVEDLWPTQEPHLFGNEAIRLLGSITIPLRAQDIALPVGIRVIMVLESMDEHG